VLAKGSTFYDTVNMTIDEDCPQGTQIQFDYEIEALPDFLLEDSFELTIGRYPVLVIDVDPNSFSAPIIAGILDELGLHYNYVNYIPEDLAQNQNLFVLLGRKFSNYVLTPVEGEIMADFLQNHGNIYMEGGLTWAEDPPTQVHQMFNISAFSINWTLIDPLVGVENTFTDNMEFNFDGAVQIYNNYLIPEAPAYTVLKKEENEHVFAVAYDEGSYKTVGSNIDFGGLVDGEHPSTKKNLLAKILIFFGQDIIITNTVDADIYPSSKLTCFPNPFSTYTTLGFYLEQEEIVDLSLYNVHGQKVASLLSHERLSGGKHHKTLSGTDLPRGIYYCVLSTKSTKTSIKLAIIH
jgi:hypothetical protein